MQIELKVYCSPLVFFSSGSLLTCIHLKYMLYFYSAAKYESVI